MKETADDFEPRRDKWFEHEGTWDEVTVGTIIGSRRRSQRWEIVDQAHGSHVEFGHTLFMRAREMTTSEEFTVQPRCKTGKVVILTESPMDTQTPSRTDPSDAEAVMLVVERLGATHLASRDNVTGEITCPDYAAGHTHSSDYYGSIADEMEHLRFAHGIDTRDLEALPFDERIRQVAITHGRGHDPNHQAATNHGGFPHRHVPEDLTIFTGKRS